MTVRIFSGVLQAQLHAADGSVMLHAAQIGLRVRDRAREKVGVSKPKLFTGIPSGPAENPGRHIRDAIIMRIEPPVVKVGLFSDPEATIGLYHHQGTRPHVIRARNRKMLRFLSSSGRIVYAHRVFHPGTRPNHFLTDALEEVARSF
jgi:hypothetical protein